MMNQNYFITLNEQKNEVKYSLKFATKIGDNISKTLFGTGNYFVQSQVNDINFNNFLDFLIGKIKYPEINTDSYYDYLLLSNEFNNILYDYLSRPEFEKYRKESMIQTAVKKEMANKSYAEEYIAEHLDEYLELYKDEMSKIPCSTLYNILMHKKRVLNNHEKAYQFIKCNIDKSDSNTDINDKKSFCILLETLDADKINEESLKESLSKRELRFGFAPKINFSFISSFNQSISELKGQFECTVYNLMQHQIQMMNSIQTLVEKKISSIQSNFDSLSNQSKETRNDMTILTDKINNIESKIKKITSNYSPINNSIKTFAESIKIIEKEINSISEKVDEIERNNTKIGKKCDDINSYIQQLSNKLNDITNSNKQIFDKVCDTLSISIANIGTFRGIIRQLTDECSGNVSDKGVINVTSSSFQSICWEKNFGSSKIQKSWRKYDFKYKKVCPICYLIRSSKYGKGCHHPMSWVIEGSNSDLSNDWTILDTRNNITFLDDNSAVQLFTILKTNYFYRYLRIRPTNRNPYENLCNFLEIPAPEYFGSFQ